MIYELEKMNLKGAAVIDGFPSVGLVSTIVGNYIINVLNLKQIGVVDSPLFPSLSIVRDSEPLSPVRIYAGTRECGENEKPEQCQKIVVFISEFVPPPQLVRPIASSMLSWFEENKCDIIISPEGLAMDIPLLPSGRGEEKEDIPVFGVGSTKRVKSLLASHNVKPFANGAITGVSASLLTEGKRREIDVACLLTEASELYPDARAAGNVLKIIDEALLHTGIDTTPLFREAEAIENQIKKMQRQAEPVVDKSKSSVPPAMYG